MKIATFLNDFRKPVYKVILVAILALILLIVVFYQNRTHFLSFFQKESNLKQQLAAVNLELSSLKNQDQIKINERLSEEVKHINETYQKSSSVYVSLVDLKAGGKKYDELDKLYAASIKYLSDKNYASASATLVEIEKKIGAEKKTLATASQTSAQNSTPPTVNNTPPGSGSYRKQAVQTANGTFTVDIITADLNTNKVIIDTASDSDCRDNCPVLPLADYVSRSGAWAGINGSFFCPSTYPNCAGKTNSFDTLLMNKNKKYFNSDNNVYSDIPAVIFSAGNSRFVGRTQEWGRDTGVDAVIANYPLLTINGQNAFGGSADSKINGKGSRCFIGGTGSTAYIGIVYNASASEAAEVLKTLDIQNSLGLDQGGSTALWYAGYRAGPGRNIPNAVLFTKR